MTDTAVDTGGRATIQALLDSYGLGSLTDWYWSKVVSGEPDAQIMIELRKTPEYAARFPGMAELSKNGRAIDEGTYISIEKQYVSLFRQAGLPEGFYDSPDDFGKFIGSEVSPQEMGARLDVARRYVFESPPEVLDEAARLYGLRTGDLMAAALDPTKSLPILQNRFNAAAAGAASKLSGYGVLTQAEAERVGLAGQSFMQDAQAFGQLVNSAELFKPIIGETGGDTISREDQLGAAFGGNINAQRRIEQTAKKRLAAFQGGGGYATTNQGVTGLASASS